MRSVIERQYATQPGIWHHYHTVPDSCDIETAAAKVEKMQALFGPKHSFRLKRVPFKLKDMS